MRPLSKNIEYMLFFYFSAKEKVRKERIHVSGGGPKPAKLTTVEEAIKRIMGLTPTFTGAMSRAVDSAIVMTRTENNNDLQAKVCNATRTGQASSLARALNTGKQLY